MPKILFVIDTLEVGGTEQSLMQLVENLSGEEFQCVVCSLYSGTSLAREFESCGARVVSFELPRKYQFPSAVRKLSRLIKDESPDLVHTMLFRASQVGRVAARLRRKPVISSFVNVPYDASRRVTDPSIKSWKLRCLQRCDAATARWVTRFHAVSKTAKEFNCRDLRVPMEKVSVIPRGRDTTKYLASTRPESANGQSPCVLNVGRLIAQKGQSHLISAIADARRRIPGIRLMIAGDGPLHRSLEEQINRRGLSGQVSLLGRRDDIPDLLNQADVFAFPSLYEGLPGSLIEAMLAGCPIVAADIPQIAELIDHRKTGLLFPAQDDQALADAVCRLLTEPELAKTLGAQARRVALLRYDIKIVTQQMKDLYLEVLGKEVSGER